MDDVLTLVENEVRVVAPTIEFPEYGKLKEDATMIAERIRSMEITEDNLKESKKTLAKVNKAIGKLDAVRKRIKGEILSPYEVFEDQVKEIKEIVKSADTEQRNKVRTFEEAERDRKKEKINAIWIKRLPQFKYNDLVTFSDFWKEEYANKTYSMSKTEDEMAAFLQKTTDDIDFIYTFDGASDIIVDYLKCFDVREAMQRTKDRHQRRDDISRSLEGKPLDVAEIQVMDTLALEFRKKKDYKLVKDFCDEHSIEYKEL